MKSGLHFYMSRHLLPLEKIALILPKDDRQLPFSCPNIELIGVLQIRFTKKERLKQFVQKCLLPHHDNQKKNKKWTYSILMISNL
jgi:hypothetical protein